MKLLHNNKYIEELFKDLCDLSKTKKAMQSIVSMDILRSIKRKLDQLLASPNFYFVISKHIGKCEPLVGNMKGKYSIYISANYRLIISPNTSDLSNNSLMKCEEFYIEGVVDYHGTKQTWIIP